MRFAQWQRADQVVLRIFFKDPICSQESVVVIFSSVANISTVSCTRMPFLPPCKSINYIVYRKKGFVFWKKLFLYSEKSDANQLACVSIIAIYSLLIFVGCLRTFGISAQANNFKSVTILSERMFESRSIQTMKNFK